MNDLPRRLDDLGSTVERLMKIGGTPGLQILVSQHGHIIHSSSHGYSDLTHHLPITTNTILPICSLTKAFITLSLSILIDRRLLQWTTLIRDLVPSFHIDDDVLQSRCTVLDLATHSSGMQWSDNLWMGSANNILIQADRVDTFLNTQKRVGGFREAFAYNNTGYEILGRVVECASGVTCREFMEENIFRPLGMGNTSMGSPPPPSTHQGRESESEKRKGKEGRLYNVLTNSQQVEIEGFKAADHGFGYSVGIRSTPSDLMLFYHHLLNGGGEVVSSERLREMFTPQIAIDEKASYALGWAVTTLPSSLGQIGLNPRDVDVMPIIAPPSEYENVKVVFHSGAGQGALHSVILLPDPDLDVVILVMSNALAKTDVADWVSQCILEEVLNVEKEKKTDFCAYAEMAVKECDRWNKALEAELMTCRNNAEKPEYINLDEYVGIYWDKRKCFKIEIYLRKNKQGKEELHWLLQGLESERFSLECWQKDLFSWWLPRDEQAKRGRWTGKDQEAEFWKIKFTRDENEKIASLVWAHDSGVPAVEYFRI